MTAAVSQDPADIAARGAAAAAQIQANSQLWQAIADAAKEIRSPQESVNVTAGAAALATATLTTGYVIWAIRGGSLLAGMLAALPMWRWVDPLPVLESTENVARRRRRWFRRWHRNGGSAGPDPTRGPTAGPRDVHEERFQTLVE
jgi:hypothetical protein